MKVIWLLVLAVMSLLVLTASSSSSHTLDFLLSTVNYYPLHHNRQLTLRSDTTPRELAEAEQVIQTAQRSQEELKRNFSPRGMGSSSVKINERQEATRDAMRWAWKGYKDYAWGEDHLLPISKSSDTWFDLALTLVDALDTLYVMGLTEEFKEAEAYIQNDFSLDSHKDVNLFETTIRILGGFLSTYQLSENKLFLDLAVDLGDRLLVAFDTQSGIPLSDVNLRKRTAHGPTWTSQSSSSEVTTLQLEFTCLSHLTGDDKYRHATDRVIEIVDQTKPADGLIPQWINPKTGTFSGSTLTLGARGDSYYEYLLKSWLQTGKQHDHLKEMYLDAVASVEAKMIGVTERHKMTFVGEIQNGKQRFPKMDHLVCFFPGTLALGAKHGLGGGMNGRHMQLAKEIMETCYHMYADMPAGLSPEISHFRYHDVVPDSAAGRGSPDKSKSDIIVKNADAHNLLRPETVESLFYMWRITGDEKYRDWGWEIFQSFEQYCRVKTGGYTSLSSVLTLPPPSRDKMESFFLGETLKYFYLLFSDDLSLMNLDQMVFNTEAHPFPVFDDGDYAGR